jgi:hypothetical protein
MTLDSSYIGYLGFLGIDLFKSVLMYSNGTICLIKLHFKMGLFTVLSLLSPPGPGSVRLCNAMETELPHSPSLPHPASQL